MNSPVRKRFGQNFLTDRRVVERIVRAINIQPTDHLIEIGPGRGALTLALVGLAEQLTAIEIDRDLARELAENPELRDRMTIHEADALRFDFSALCPAGNLLRIVGNLPYNISTALLFRLLDQADVIDDMHFMLQKEVVDRMCALPNTKEYGRLGVVLQAQASVQRLFIVAPGAFWPVPKVQSAVVRIAPHGIAHGADEHLPRLDDPRTLSEVAARAFSQRRKTLHNALERHYPALDLGHLEIDATARPQTLSVAEFIRISNHLSALSSIS